MDNGGYCVDYLDADAGRNGKGEPIQESRMDTRILTSYHRRSALAQCCATFVNSLAFISLGLLVGIPTVVIENTRNAEGGLSLDDEQVSWYVSLLPIFQPLGCILGGVFQNYIGRKHGLLLMNVSTTIAWFLLYTAASVEILYLSSILMGISVGFSEAPGLSYVCEISTPQLRGILVSYTSSGAVFGIMLTLLLAALMGWRTSCLVCMGLCIFSVLLLLLVPDSSIWLINKGRQAEALKAVSWLRGWVPATQVKEEFDELCRTIENSGKQFDGKNSSWKSRLRIDQLLHASTMRPFIFLQCYTFFSCAAGLIGARNYFLVIFDGLNLPINSTSLGLLMWVAAFFGNIVCFASVRILGKRQLSLVTMFLCSSITLLMGLYLLFRHELNQPWIFTILVFNNLGIVSLQWILLSEIYPVKIRSIATGLTGASYYVTISIFVKTYHYLEQLMSTEGAFVLYSVIGFVGFFYVWFFMPETEGKTISEIEELFLDDARKLCPHFRKKK